MIDIVIVNWNSGDQLRNCVDTIVAFGQKLVTKIIVVDNGSVDGSDTTIDGIDKVTLIRADVNLGFGRACNLGARQASSSYILFLNPDAALMEGSLGLVYDFMKDAKNAKVGICGVQLIEENGNIARSCSRSRTVSNMICHTLGLDRLFWSCGPAMRTWDHKNSQSVDQLIGAFYLIRRSLFTALDGFDERFFVYYEEVDLAERARLAGWSSYYLADVRAFHAGGGTSYQVKAHRLFYSMRSRLQYAEKHFSTLGFVLIVFCTLLIEPLTRFFMALSRSSLVDIKQLFIAIFWLWLWLIQGANGGTKTS